MNQRSTVAKWMTAASCLFVLHAASAGLLFAADGPVEVGVSRTEVAMENDFIKIVVNPAAGGAITEIRYKKATTVAPMATAGGGVAGTGRFFTDVAQVLTASADAAGPGKGVLNLADHAYALDVVDKGPDLARIRLTAKVPSLADAVTVERVISMARGESAFRVTQTFANPSVQPITAQFGCRIEQRNEAWRTDLRLWLGDSRVHRWYFGPYSQSDKPESWRGLNGEAQLQLLGQYGVGLIARANGIPSPLEYTVHYPRNQRGVPCNAHWISAPATLDEKRSLTMEMYVIVCEGMRETMALTPEGMAVASYAQECADPKEAFPAFGVVVSGARRTVDVAIEKSVADKKWENLVTRALALEPGKARELRAWASSDEKGTLNIRCVARKEEKELCSGAARVLIDDAAGSGTGDAAARRNYVARFPEKRYSGAWTEIGRQLLKDGVLRRPAGPGRDAASVMALYRQRFPFYADILRGAAEAANCKPEEMIAFDAAEGPPASVACIAMLFNGPDGPLIGFSKERNDSSVRGLGYLQVKPARGYALQMYTMGGTAGYGINEAGLATGGATINCDDETMKKGNELTAQWRKDGKPTAPMGAMMMLAMCATVDEAIRFIEDEQAPLDFTGNILIVDKQGDAAVLQSQGILHSVRRYGGPKDRLDVSAPVFSATNYAHPNDAGLFKPGQNWRWHVNALLRERRVGGFVHELNGQVGLKDLMWIMRTQDQPGGIAQQRWDNVGQLYTVTSCIAVPRTGDLFLTCGNPMAARCERYRLAD